MKRTALAVLVALSVPFAAAADAHPGGRPGRDAPPFAAPVRPDHELWRLVDRYLEALARPGERRRVARLEAEVGRAIDRQVAEARLQLAALRPWPGAGAPRHAGWRVALAEARARVDRLSALQDDFARLQGRHGRRAAALKADLARELVRLAGLEPWRAPAPPPALAYRPWR